MVFNCKTSHFKGDSRARWDSSSEQRSRCLLFTTVHQVHGGPDHSSITRSCCAFTQGARIKVANQGC